MSKVSTPEPWRSRSRTRVAAAEGMAGVVMDRRAMTATILARTRRLANGSGVTHTQCGQKRLVLGPATMRNCGRVESHQLNPTPTESDMIREREPDLRRHPRASVCWPVTVRSGDQ